MTVEIIDTILPKSTNGEDSRKMKSQAEVQRMLRLHREGYNPHRIALLPSCSRTMVVRYVRQGRWQPARRPHGTLGGFGALAGTVFHPIRRQCRCGASGTVPGTRHRAVVADDGGTGGATIATTVARGTVCQRSVRIDSGDQM